MPSTLFLTICEIIFNNVFICIVMYIVLQVCLCEDVRSLELELQAVMGCHEGAEN